MVVDFAVVEANGAAGTRDHGAELTSTSAVVAYGAVVLVMVPHQNLTRTRVPYP